MTNQIQVEHFTAIDYDNYVIISSSLNDNKPFKYLTKGVYWAAHFYPPLFGKYKYLYFSKDELNKATCRPLEESDEDIDDVIAGAFVAACFRNGVTERHNWLLSTDEDDEK